MLNGINEKRLSHKHKVKVVNKPGATSERILDEIDDVIKSKSEHLVIHVGTNDRTNGINLWNNARKLSKRSTKSYLRHVSHFRTEKAGKTLTKILQK